MYLLDCIFYMAYIVLSLYRAKHKHTVKIAL